MQPGFIETHADENKKPPNRISAKEQIFAGIIALGCLTLLSVAAWLHPNPLGTGTHCALNLPPCLWESNLDWPCPTCGMTTAFAHAANGNFIKSFLVQPMGFLLAIATAMTFWIAAYIAVTGSIVGRLLLMLWRPWFVWCLGGITLAAWLYKICIY